MGTLLQWHAFVSSITLARNHAIKGAFITNINLSHPRIAPYPPQSPVRQPKNQGIQFPENEFNMQACTPLAQMGEIGAREQRVNRIGGGWIESHIRCCLDNFSLVTNEAPLDSSRISMDTSAISKEPGSW